MNRLRRRGTTLIELLVVIVIFLIGILGIVQLFPAGFQSLLNTRNTSVANELARSQIEAVKGRSDQLPEQILPVRYIYNGTNVAIEVDYRRNNGDFGPAGVGIDQDGDVIDAANVKLGNWGLLTGANVMTRVVGEGGRVPAPRNVGGAVGGLMVLQFAPIRYDVNDITLAVYGNDLVRRYGNPRFGSINRPYEYFVSEENGGGSTADTLYVPVVGAVGSRPYRISFNFYVVDGGVYRQKVVLDFSFPQSLAPSTAYPGYWELDIQTIVTGLGLLSGSETYAGLDEETVRVQRSYTRLANAASFSADPYEYVLLNPDLGILLFNPRGYNTLERRQGNTRVPLQARVDYDVYDWRIIREEFRLPDTAPYQQKLILNSLKVKGQQGADGRTFNGLGTLIPDGLGGTIDVDVVLLDVDSGGVYLHDPSNPPNPTPPVGVTNETLQVDPARSSYAVDKSLGLLKLADADTATAGLQLRLILPGTNVPVVVNASGRKVRALYMAKNEWAVQVLKAPSVYSVTFGEPVSATYYVGTSSAFGGQPTRIYFPGSDIGKKVTLGEIWYISSTNGLQVMRDQDFLVTATPSDPLGVPYIDIRSVDQSATTVDFSNGYAVRRVKGASVSARVLWNPATFTLSNDSAENLRRFEIWSRNWRRTVVETYLERTAN